MALYDTHLVWRNAALPVCNELQSLVQSPSPPWYNRDMATPPLRRVTYTHPDMPLLPPMTGNLERDDWEGCDMFYPDPQHAPALFSLYGYDDEAGLYLDGATVTPL